MTSSAVRSDRDERTGKWWMLGAVSASTFMLLLDVTVVNVALPDIQRGLDASFTDLQWVVDAYAVTLAALLLTAGSLADRLGRRRVFVTGLVVFTAASLWCGAASGPLVLEVARAVQGVGGAVLYAVAPALIAQGFHGRQRALAFGVSGGVTGLAVALGPLIGGAVTAVSWRWIFWLNVPVGVLVAVTILVKVGESRRGATARIDWPGMLVLSTVLALVVLGLTSAQDAGPTSPLVITLAVAVLALLAVFVVIERTRRDPMLDLRMFANRSVVGLSVATLALSAAAVVTILFQVMYLQYVLGFSPFATGVRYLPLTLAVFLAAALTGTVAARLPAGLLMGIGGVALGAGWWCSTGLAATSAWTALLPGMVLAGFGLGVFNPTRAAAAVDLVPADQAGMSSGASETFQQGGVALGVAALGSAADGRIRDTVTALLDRGSGLPAEEIRHVSGLAASGRFAELTGAVAPAYRDEVGAVLGQAFVAGLDLVMRGGAVLALIGGVVGFALIRRRDFPTRRP